MRNGRLPFAADADAKRLAGSLDIAPLLRVVESRAP